MLPGNENFSELRFDIASATAVHNRTEDFPLQTAFTAVKRLRKVIAIASFGEVFIMKKTRLSTETIVVMGLLIALVIVLSKLVSINISFLRIGFGFLPVAIMAILYGPVWAAAGYAIADLIGAFLFPTGPFNPGFTLSAFLTGLIFGLVLYKKEVTIVRAIIASALVCLLVNLLLNTYWLTFIIGKAFNVLVASRAVKELVAIPIMAILIVAMDKTAIKAFNSRGN